MVPHMLPPAEVRLWTLPVVCVLGTGVGRLLLRGLTTERDRRPRVPWPVVGLGALGGVIGWSGAGVMLNPAVLSWFDRHVPSSPLFRARAEFIFVFIPTAIIAAGPGLLAGWIVRRVLGWHSGISNEMGMEIMVVPYLIALTAFCFAYIITAAAPWNDRGVPRWT